MTARPALVVAAAMLFAACGGGSDEADITIPEITLITTTTEPPLFETGDGAVTDEDAEPADADTDAADTDAADTDASDSVPSTEAPTSSEPTDAEAPADTSAEASTSDGAPVTTAPEATTTTAAPAPETTQPPAPVGGSFVLGADGLGAVQFGADPEGTITFVSSLIGAPTLDTGWVPPFDIGPCGGTQVRQVSWNDLTLEFGDVSDITQGRDHLYAYYYGRVGSSAPTPPGFVTANNIGVGSTVADLIAAYPGTIFRQGDDFIEPNFSISDNLSGLLSGLADDDVIEVIVGGLPCNG